MYLCAANVAVIVAISVYAFISANVSVSVSIEHTLHYTTYTPLIYTSHVYYAMQLTLSTLYNNNSNNNNYKFQL